jgi:hypothetical protein
MGRNSSNSVSKADESATRRGPIEYIPIERLVLTPDQAVAYLALPSRNALQRLVDRKELAPLTYAKEHRFHRTELDRFLDQQLECERQRRGIRAPDLG